MRSFTILLLSMLVAFVLLATPLQAQAQAGKRVCPFAAPSDRVAGPSLEFSMSINQLLAVVPLLGEAQGKMFYKPSAVKLLQKTVLASLNPAFSPVLMNDPIPCCMPCDCKPPDYERFGCCWTPGK